jgi:hypothetical protein
MRSFKLVSSTPRLDLPSFVLLMDATREEESGSIECTPSSKDAAESAATVFMAVDNSCDRVGKVLITRFPRKASVINAVALDSEYQPPE